MASTTSGGDAATTPPPTSPRPWLRAIRANVGLAVWGIWVGACALGPGDRVHRILFWLAARTILFAALIVGVDAYASGNTWEFASNWRLSDADLGPAYVRQLLLLLGLPGAILVSLTSLAVPTLSPYGNPSLLLLHVRRPQGFLGHVLRFLLGRGNPFLHALQDALYVAGALAGLWALNKLQWGGNYPPTLVLITLVALLEILLLLHFVLWVIRLRQPPELFQHMKLLLNQALRPYQVRVGASGTRPASLRQAADSEVEGFYTCTYEEQEEVKQLALAITHTTLRVLSDQQPLSAVEGLDVLDAVYVEAQRDYRIEWRQMRKLYLERGRQADWLSRLVVDGFREILLATIDADNILVREEAQRRLSSITGRLLSEDPNPDRVRTLEQILQDQYAEAYGRCVGTRDEARHALLRDLNGLFGLVTVEREREASEAARISQWRTELERSFSPLASAMGTAAVLANDVIGLRGVADFMNRARLADPNLRPQIAQVTLNLGATALAARADKTVAMLAGWVPDIFDPDGEVFPGEAARNIDSDRRPVGKLGVVREQLLRPDYVTLDYVQVFLVLVAARSRQYGREAWTRDPIATQVRKAVEDLGDSSRRCAWTCERVGRAVGYADGEVQTWTGRVAEVL